MPEKKKGIGVFPYAAFMDGQVEDGRPEQVASGDDSAFRQWYSTIANQYGLNPDPDDPRQFYDYRAAFKAGALPDASGHWPSDFKKPGHPNMVVGGFHVQTGERVPNTKRATRDELVKLGWDEDTATKLSQTPEPKKSGIGIVPYAAFAAGQVADGWTTKQALDRGAKEWNPLMGQSIGRILATKAGMNAGVLLAMRALAKDHPKIAKALGYAGGTIGALAAGHNMRVMR